MDFFSNKISKFMGTLYHIKQSEALAEACRPRGSKRMTISLRNIMSNFQWRR